VGKWALNPQTRMNTGFQRGHFHFKSGQKVGFWPFIWAKNPKIRPNNLQKSTQFFEKLKKPTLQKLKVGVDLVLFLKFSDEFCKKKRKRSN
jgi:hypothetical protein